MKTAGRRASSELTKNPPSKFQMASEPKRPNSLPKPHPPLNQTEEFFHCSFKDCDYKSNWEKNVGLHEKSHNPTGNWNIPCQVCPQNFGYLVSFFHHMSSQHSNKLFCPWCLFLGRDFDDFKAHMLAHISTPAKSSLPKAAKVPGKFSCGTCSKTFTRRRDLFRHQTLSCKSSSFPTASKTTIQAAICNGNQVPVENSKPKGFKPTLDTVTTEDDQILKKFTTNEYLRDDCSKTLTVEQSLVRHQEMSCNSNQPAAVPNQNYLKKVIKVPRKMLRCAKCSYKTLRPDNFRNHSRIHSSVKPFKCPNLGCAYKSHWAQCLQRHGPRCRGRIHIPDQANSIASLQHDKAPKEAPSQTDENSGSDKDCEQKTEGKVKSGIAFACMLCDFMDNSELVALKHARQHKTVVIVLNRI